jgi:hypothetical protein
MSFRTAPPVSMEKILTGVQSAIERVRTKTVDFSFNELADMYGGDELRIDPAYQRLFRWDEEKQSQFIESLVLELPIPPIYVVEEEEGRYELIDGLQRFSSYLHFRGVLKNAETGDLEEPLVLDGCDIVEELNGATYKALPTALQIRLKRMAVPVQIVRKESDPRIRYHMFKRLNTGGEPLSSQEIRNATIRLLGSQFNDFIQGLAKRESFVVCTDIMTAEAKKRMTREECVLRFFAFKNDFGNYTKLVTPFLDQYMERVSDESDPAGFDYSRELATFETTFELFAKTLGRQSFSTVSNENTLGNQFSQAHFDMLTLGVQRDLTELSKRLPENADDLRESLRALKTDATFRSKTTGGGRNYRAAYETSIKYVEDWVAQWLRTV